MGLIGFTSCDPESFGNLLEQKPNVEFVESSGYAINNSTVYAGNELQFLIQMSPNETSGSPLKTFLFVINDSNGNILFDDTKDLTGSATGTIEITEVFTPKLAETLEITATVTDEVGKKNMAAMVITSVLPPNEDENIGTFRGNIKIICDVTSDTPALNEQQINLDDEAEITLSANANNETQATFVIDDTEIILTGRREGNKFVFDQFNYTTVVNLVMEIDITLNINMTGVLEDRVLTINGDVNGEGTTPNIFNLVQASLNGSIGGSMTLVEE